jgi:hypothetical protein
MAVLPPDDPFFLCRCFHQHLVHLFLPCNKIYLTLTMASTWVKVIFWTNTENFLLLTQIRILSKFLIFTPWKKTHQIYTNLKNCLDLCQKNWNQSKYWKLSPMHLNYNQILKILPTTFLHLSQTKIWISISIWCCLFYVQRFEIEVVVCFVDIR